MIAAQKAHTANALSLPGIALSTENLYGAVQPGQGLYGLQHSMPVDTETALETARQQVCSWRTTMRSYEQVESTKAELEKWLVQQAYAGMLHAVEVQPETANRAVIQGKLAIAELAESALRRLCRVVGGGSYARHSPFGFWLEDVRALGFLRPPWSLMYERLFSTSWQT